MYNIFFDQKNTPFPEDPYYNPDRAYDATQPMGGQPILLIDPAPKVNLVGENLNYGAHSEAGIWTVCGNYKSAPKDGVVHEDEVPVLRYNDEQEAYPNTVLGYDNGTFLYNHECHLPDATAADASHGEADISPWLGTIWECPE